MPVSNLKDAFFLGNTYHSFPNPNDFLYFCPQNYLGKVYYLLLFFRLEADNTKG
jgi:hypothetical protein